MCHVTVRDCWNEIGVQGNRSCRELAKHAHCRHCPSYLSAARMQLGRPASEEQIAAWTEQYASPLTRPDILHCSSLIVRCGPEWMGIPTQLCGEVTNVRVVRSLPHRRSPAVLGLTNVRGALMPCVSLSKLLEMQESVPPHSSRLVVLARDGVSTAVQVDEVMGTHRYAVNDLRPLPGTVPAGDDRLFESILPMADRRIGILGAVPLVTRLARCLA